MNGYSTLVEQTQKKILHYISTNPDTKHLPKENEFAEILGVSRGVLRESLSQLRALGIIETKRKKGTVVVSPNVFGVLKPLMGTGLLDKKSLKDLYQLRLMLEIGAADFIFMGKNDRFIEELDAIVGQEADLDQQMSLAKDEATKIEIAEKLKEVDIQFHAKLFEITGNQDLMDFQFIIRHLFTLYSPRMKKDYHDRNIVSHIGLFNLLRNGTPDAFRMAMRLHLSTQFENMEANIEKAGAQ
ncbi:MAG: FadR family transcriptional regulator [Bacteroidales bacterium]|nr:FadR family transcriptional regulator [Bacteroidales bacterium]